MTYRVAAATSDGVTVDSHFGHVTEFEILEVDEETGAYEEIEYRKSLPACGGGACGEGDVMDQIAENLKDVSYVLAANTGPHAVLALSRHGIRALDAVLPINQAIAKIQNFRQIQKKFREGPG